MWGRFATCLVVMEEQVANLLHIERLPKTCTILRILKRLLDKIRPLHIIANDC